MLPSPKADEENAFSFPQAGEENASAFPQENASAIGSTPATISQVGGCDGRRRNGHLSPLVILG